MIEAIQNIFNVPDLRKRIAFMLALLATYGLPALVEAGVFLDVLVAVLVAKVVLGEIRESIQSTDIDRLRELRG